jgi:hypothetical protein
MKLVHAEESHRSSKYNYIIKYINLYIISYIINYIIHLIRQIETYYATLN